MAPRRDQRVRESSVLDLDAYQSVSSTVGRTATAVDAFLEDEAAIARIKEQARDEAQRRAREWGFDEFTTGAGDDS